ncbi:HAD-IIA family hydrolase [Rhizobiaceae bacterium]|nr:HAD-IIA family hydrolase [Rhizobiaceae bacterium]
MPSSSDVHPVEPFFEGFDTESAFAFYEAVRQRLPTAHFPQQATRVGGLRDMAEHCDTFCFDAFGVLNVGNTPIPGAREAVAHLRAMGKRLFVITNAATNPKPAAIAKFEGLGFDFQADEIVTSRMAAEKAVMHRASVTWGVMARADFQPGDVPVPSVLLGDDPADYDAADAFLLLSTWEWTSARQLLLEASLKASVRPVVVANPDVIAPLETSFSTEAGYIAHRLADLCGVAIEFHGKPFPSVFDLVERSLPENVDRSRICMIGDTLHTDVLGGAHAGWTTVLVSDHGLFRGQPVAPFIERSGIVPDWIVPCI